MLTRASWYVLVWDLVVPPVPLNSTAVEDIVKGHTCPPLISHMMTLVEELLSLADTALMTREFDGHPARQGGGKREGHRDEDCPNNAEDRQTQGQR